MFPRKVPKMLSTFSLEMHKALMPTPSTPYSAQEIGLSQNMVFKNGKLIDAYNKDSNTFLLDFPRGAYTTMRTLVNQRAIFQFEHHIKRLIQSSTIMIEEERTLNETIRKDIIIITPTSESSDTGDSYDVSILFDEKQLSNLIKSNLRDNIIEFRKNVFSSNQSISEDITDERDLKLTALITWRQHLGKRFDLYTHLTHLPPRPSNPVQVDVRRGSRVQMKAKDSVWVVERRGVTDHKTPESNEVILCEDNGNVREGASSNFFVIKDDNIIYTADHGILKGTVQIMLLEDVVKAVNQLVKYDIPNLNDLSHWKEAFITSTSRLVLPIHSLFIAADCVQFVDEAVLSRLEKIPEHNGYLFKLLPDCKQSPISEALNNALVDHMVEKSEMLDLD